MVVVGAVRVVGGGDEVAQRLAGELAPAEQQVQVHHEALAAEAPAQHVVDGAEHAHEALSEPGGLHASAAAGRLDPLVGVDGEIHIWCRAGKCQQRAGSLTNESAR